MNRFNKYIKISLIVLLITTCLSYAQVPVLVKDINLGVSGSSPQFLTPFAGKLYFGTSNLSGLWMTDGSEAGTVLAEGMATIGNDFVSELSVLNNQLYFNTFSMPGWWSTMGGIDNATEIMTDIQAFGTTLYSSSILGSDVLVFAGKDSLLAGSPVNLYRSDGTTAGTMSIGTFNSSNGPSPRGFWHVNGQLLFSANETATGRELYKTDATTATTQLVKDIDPFGSGLSDVSGMGGVVLNNALYIPAFSDNPSGTKIWKSDGSTVGTVAVYDSIGVGNGSRTDYNAPKFLTVFNNAVYFFATAGTSPRLQLWKVATADVHPIQITFDADFNPPSGVFGCSGNLTPMVVGSTLYFQREDNTNGCELWSSNGTIMGTQMLKDINPGGADAFPILMVGFNEELYFTALKVGFGFELWHSDGSASGTLMVSDLNPGNASSILNTHMTEYQGELYFSAEDGLLGQELYKITFPVIDPIFKDGFEQIGPI
jgi:ELWxxDGT repeat protein